MSPCTHLTAQDRAEGYECSACVELRLLQAENAALRKMVARLNDAFLMSEPDKAKARKAAVDMLADPAALAVEPVGKRWPA